MPPLPEAPPPAQVAADRRTLTVIWLAITMGVVLIVAVMAFLISTGAGGAMAEQRTLFFYLSAVFSVVAIAAAFTVQRGLDARLLGPASYAEAAALIRTRAILSAAVLEASALFAAVAAFLTGELIDLAFVVPFFAFVALFFPSEGRYAYWLALRERG